MSRPYRLSPPLPRKKETITWLCRECGARRAAYVGQKPREWTGSPLLGFALCGKCSWAQRKQILAERGELALRKP